jgi:hypothetical protein
MSVRSPESVHDRIPAAGSEAQAVQIQARTNLSHEFVNSKPASPKTARSENSTQHSTEHCAGNDPSLKAFGHLTLVHGEQASAASSRPEPSAGGKPQFDEPVAPGGTGASQPGRGRPADESGPRSPDPENKGEQPVVNEYPDGHKKSTYPDGVTISEWPDGQSETRYPDGKSVYRWPDGDKETDYPSGKKEFNYHDGDSELILPNGIDVYTQASGAHQINYPDGLFQSFDANGVLVGEDPALAG